MKHLLIAMSVLFLACNSERSSARVQCYAFKNPRFMEMDTTFAQYCDTLIAGIRHYSEVSQDFEGIHIMDSIAKAGVSPKKVGTCVHKDSNRSIELVSIRRLGGKDYYVFFAMETLGYYAVYTKDLGIIFAKFDYRKYLILEEVKEGHTIIDVSKDVEYAIQALKGHGGWDFRPHQRFK